MRNEKPHFVLNHDKLNELTAAERADRLFSDNYRLIGSMSAYKKAFPAQYAAAKSIPLPPSKHEELQAIRAGYDRAAGPRTYSELELYVRGKISEEAAKADDVNLTDLAKKPIPYAERQVARASYGLPGIDLETALARLAEVSRIPESVVVEPMFTLSEDLARAVSLTPGQKVDLNTFNSAVRACNRLDEEAEARRITEQAKQILEAEKRGEVVNAEVQTPAM